MHELESWSLAELYVNREHSTLVDEVLEVSVQVQRKAMIAKEFRPFSLAGWSNTIALAFISCILVLYSCPV